MPLLPFGSTGVFGTSGASDVELAAHEADTTSIHGITDTSVLATTAFIGSAVTSTTSMVNATDTQMAFTATTFDTHSYVSGNTFVVPSGKAGKYAISASVATPYLGGGVNLHMQVTIKKNGTVIHKMGLHSSDNLPNQGLSSTTPPTVLAVADIITFFAEQNSGADRTPDIASFGIEFLGT